eukprot:1622313-Lingulodinium_polyedra.AAC.1
MDRPRRLTQVHAPSPAPKHGRAQRQVGREYGHTRTHQGTPMNIHAVSWPNGCAEQLWAHISFRLAWDCIARPAWTAQQNA